jgi:hypothetical protein
MEERGGLDGMRKEVGKGLFIWGVHLVAGVKISTLMVLYEGICEWIQNIRDLIVKECRKSERVSRG